MAEPLSLEWWLVNHCNYFGDQETLRKYADSLHIIVLSQKNVITFPFHKGWYAVERATNTLLFDYGDGWMERTKGIPYLWFPHVDNHWTVPVAQTYVTQTLFSQRAKEITFVRYFPKLFPED
jgi:beta-xylosidase